MKNMFNNSFLFKYFCLVILFFITIYTLYRGFELSPDSRGFIDWANLLNTRFQDYFSQNSPKGQVSVTYLTTVVIIFFLKNIFPNYWEYVFLLINLSIHFITTSDPL